MRDTTGTGEGMRPGFGRRLLRNLMWASVIYPTLFAITALLAVAAAYAWPWLLDPASP